jgi:hypothetical protein
MKNSQWGPAGWLFIHSISFQYPETPSEEDKTNYKMFFDSLQNTLPCPNCQEHYKQNLKENPINLDSRDGLIQWVIDIHNAVNEKNGEKIYSREEVEGLYKSKYSYSIGANESVESNMSMILFIILVIVIVIYFLKR